jgi:bifunctional non-homologous end joining protein LigD
MPGDVRGRVITWVEPVVVAEVEFAEWTPEGRLRFATFQGVRDDKDPQEVGRE